MNGRSRISTDRIRPSEGFDGSSILPGNTVKVTKVIILIYFYSVNTMGLPCKYLRHQIFTGPMVQR